MRASNCSLADVVWWKDSGENPGAEQSRVFESPARQRSLREAGWPVRMRWATAAGVVGACALARLADPRYLPDTVLAAVVALVFAYSMALSPRIPTKVGSPTALIGRLPYSAGLMLDLVSLACLILFSSGLRSPLVPFLVLPIVLAPFMVSPRSAYLAAAGASLLLAAVAVMVELADPLGLSVANAARWPDWHLFADLASWTMVFFLAAGLASSAASRLTSGNRELRDAIAQLQSQSRELADANLRLDRVIRARTSPTLGVAHQVSAHLSSIQQMLEVVLRTHADGSDRGTQEMVALARASAAGALEMVGEFLYLEQLRGVEDQFAGEPLDACEIASEVVRSCAYSARLKGVDLALGFVGRTVCLWGNREFTSRLVRNLVENATNYTPAGGRVRVSAFRQGGRAVISVSDTGIGIGSRDLSRVFDEFFRADNARKVHRTGGGLGLSVAKRIAELQNGDISVASELGRGSTFTASFPVANCRRTGSKEPLSALG